MTIVVYKRRSIVKGVYVLVLSISKSLKVKVSTRKYFSLKKGFYAYVGSAQKDLEKRLTRHLARAGKKHFWHIDYLLAANGVSVLEAFYKEAGKEEECRTAQGLSAIAFPVEGFGCSDCRCTSHLFQFVSLSLLEDTCLKLDFKPFVLSC